MFKSRQFSVVAVIIFLLMIATCTFALIILWRFSQSSYDILVRDVTHTLNRPDLKSLINNKIFPVEKYRLVYRFHWLLYLLVITIIVALLYRRKRIEERISAVVKYINDAGASVAAFYGSLPRRRLLYVVLGCIVYLSASLYMAAIKPVIYDEAWGYQYYLKMPFYYSFLLFNTYPLNNFISHFFTYLPFSDLINIRIPSILFGLITSGLFFYIVGKRLGFFWSVVAVVLLVSSPVFSTYTYLARGVSLALLFTVIAFHFLLRLANNEMQSKNRCLFMLANIFGILTMPTFILFTTAAAVLLIANRWRRKISVLPPIVDGAVMGIVSAVFYLPMLLSSGSATVFHNDHYRLNFDNVFGESFIFFSGMSELFFANKWLLGIVLAAGCIYVLITGKKGKHLVPAITSLAVIVLVFLLRLLLGNMLPERSLAFLVVPIVLLLVLSFRWIAGNAGYFVKFVIGGLVLLYGVVVYYQAQQRFLASEEDRQAKLVGDILLRHNISNIYLQEDDFWTRLPMIEFYYSEKHVDIGVHTSITSSARYKPFDTRDNYDCMVTDGDVAQDVAANYYPIYTSKDFTIWKKKE